MTSMGIGLSRAVSGMAAHIVTGVRISRRRLSRSHGVARMGICLRDAVPGMAAHIVTGVRISRLRLSRSHGVACMGIGLRGAVSGMAVHVVTSVRVRLSACGGGAMHGTDFAGAHHWAVMRRLGRRERGLFGRRRSRCGRVSCMTGVALGQGGAARGQDQGRERQRER